MKLHNVQSREVQSRILYPLMAILSLSAFMAFIYEEEATVTLCIQNAIMASIRILKRKGDTGDNNIWLCAREQ